MTSRAEVAVSFLLALALVGIVSLVLNSSELFNFDHERNNEDSLLFQPERDPSQIHVGFIVKNIATAKAQSTKLKEQVVTLLRSIRDKSAKHIHYVVLTDEESASHLVPLLEKYGKHSNRFISYDFFDIGVVANHFRDKITQLREYFTSTSTQAKKYRDDLFLLAPFYHKLFPYPRLIMLDIDLRFKVAMEELETEFDKFDESHLMGVANDLSPHYRHVVRHYRSAHPDTVIGEPGRYQGFNTGVVLFHLDRMRGNEIYNKLMTSMDDQIKELANKYSFRSHLGDQCLFTLLGFEYPELFYLLPCAYNYQLDTNMWQQEFAHIFPLYHNCSDRPKIYHGNGGATIPMNPEEELAMLGITPEAEA